MNGYCGLGIIETITRPEPSTLEMLTLALGAGFVSHRINGLAERTRLRWIRLRIRVGVLFEHHPPTANEDTRKCERARNKSRDSPHRLRKSVEPAKMQLRQ